ncbi:MULTISPECIES: C40 family peptidase [Tenebrionibacter/Tenebrionicola group]|uniref:C40 family peptidase n=1 Tax=Tenebrionibacter/Tenebrionicola group TaxID=2969848 RepID=UPI001EE8CFC4|nr:MULTISPECIES: NlpC/P60 family protein [Tenebrionibacter/Tenebrionicola group]
MKYKWGGMNTAGIDCSALMQKIFQRGLAKNLPRTTAEQIKQGQRISVSDLRPGDLVFFQTKPHTRHVGVYIGEEKFIHASSSMGVTMSSLENNYWIHHFEAARRILD